MADLSEYYLIGEVLRPHGVKGALKVRLSADFADVSRLKVLLLKPAESEEVTEVRLKKLGGSETKCHILLHGINSCNQAESIRGALLYAHQDDMPEPAEGEYFYRDLESCSVYSSDGKLLGKVQEIMENPAHPLLVIRKTDGTEELVPFIENFIKEVDIQGGRINLHPYSMID